MITLMEFFSLIHGYDVERVMLWGNFAHFIDSKRIEWFINDMKNSPFCL